MRKTGGKQRGVKGKGVTIQIPKPTHPADPHAQRHRSVPPDVDCPPVAPGPPWGGRRARPRRSGPANTPSRRPNPRPEYGGAGRPLAAVAARRPSGPPPRAGGRALRKSIGRRRFAPPAGCGSAAAPLSFRHKKTTRPAPVRAMDSGLIERFEKLAATNRIERFSPFQHPPFKPVLDSLEFTLRRVYFPQ